MLILSCLLKAAVDSLAHPIHVVFCFTDSQCTLATLKKDGCSLAPFFSKRCGKISRNLDYIHARCGSLDPPRFLHGRLNPADLGTHPSLFPNDIGLRSLWQTGPAFLSQPYPHGLLPQTPQLLSLFRKSVNFPTPLSPSPKPPQTSSSGWPRKSSPTPTIGSRSPGPLLASSELL